MDTGSACSSYNIYGQMVYWVVTPWILTTEHSQFITGLFFSYMEYGCLLLGDEAIYYAKWMISLDVITMMLLSINGTLTCYIQVMSTTQFLHPMSPSSMCVYNQHNASLQSSYLIMLVPLVTIFFLWHTCVVSCYVIYCSMPLYNLACYCIVCYYVCYKGTVFYCKTPLTLYIRYGFTRFLRRGRLRTVPLRVLVFTLWTHGAI